MDEHGDVAERAIIRYLKKHHQEFQDIFLSTCRDALRSQMILKVDAVVREIMQTTEREVHQRIAATIQHVMSETLTDDIKRYADAHLQPSLDAAIADILDEQFLEDAIATKVEKMVASRTWHLTFEE